MKNTFKLFIIYIAVVSACSNQQHFERLKRNAKSLLYIKKNLEFSSNRNSPTVDFVNIGNGLYKVLSSRTIPLNQLEIKISEGDLFGENQGVTHSIEYKTKGSNRLLMLRIRYDKSIDKYHIVGYTGKLD